MHNKDSYCYYCGKKFKPKTPEHIIPNVLGGKLKSKDILCKECNNCLGKIDKAFECFSFFNTLINPNRDNGAPSLAKVKINGMEGSLGPGGHNIAAHKLCFDREQKALHVELLHSAGEGENRNKEFVRKIIAQQHNSYSKEEVEKILNEIWNKALASSQKETNPIIHVQFHFKTDELFRAVLKIAIGFYCYLGLDRSYIAEAIKSLKEGVDFEKNINWLFLNKIQGIGTSHVLLLYGVPQIKKLYMVVSLYNSFSFFVLLNNNYNGPEVREQYVYQVMEHRRLLLRGTLSLTAQEITRILAATPQEIQRYLNLTIGHFLEERKIKDLPAIFKHTDQLGKKIQHEAEKALLNLATCKESLFPQQYNDYFIQELVATMETLEDMQILQADILRKIAKAFNKDFSYDVYLDKYRNYWVLHKLLCYIEQNISQILDVNEGFYRSNWKDRIKSIIDDFGSMSFEDHELNLYHKNSFKKNKEEYTDLIIGSFLKLKIFPLEK